MEGIYTDFIDKLDRLKDLYVKSREAIALLENYDKSQNAYLGPHNEFRNALDHIMRMVEAKGNVELCDKEYKGAESHLLRAGFDAYELICINQIEYIKNILGRYTPDDISIGFPDYYKVIKPSIMDIEKDIAKAKQPKVEQNGNLRDRFEYYFASAEKLIEYVKNIDRHIPIIEECFAKRSQKEKTHTYIGIGGLIIGIIGIIFALLK